MGEGAAPGEATAEQTKAAEKRYLEGVRLFKSGDFGQSAEAFQKSYETVASPNSHMMMARALAQAGRLTEAYEEMALAAAEASELAETVPKYGATAKRAEEERQKLMKSVGVLEIKVVPEGDVQVHVGPRNVPRNRWDLVAVLPGKVDVVARMSGGQRAWELVEVQAGQVTQVVLELKLDDGPEPTLPPGTGAATTGSADDAMGADSGDHTESSLRTYAYVAGGVGVAGILTFAVAGSMSNSTFDSLKADCPSNVCPPNTADDIDKGKRQKAIANTGFAIGLIGLSAGAGLFVFDLTRGEPKKDAAAVTKRRTQLVAGPGSVLIRRRF